MEKEKEKILELAKEYANKIGAVPTGTGEDKYVYEVFFKGNEIVGHTWASDSSSASWGDVPDDYDQSAIVW